ncbi:MAG: alpha/beta hydrolase [Bacteroidales bacterium]|nr:alpha/beta hydrolase [Bacteroidales bacterium]HOY39193.1 alpha/beta hydrolase-fold protein [Bacteroidales bacterium]HQP03325.1 alpha/beta hydrolase-fold protein [Bacteroidales bacterium]
MNKRIFLIIAMLLAFQTSRVVAQVVFNNNKPDSADIVIGKRYVIHSEVLGEDREIYIHVPSEEVPDYDTVHYPVIYVFDGSTQFVSVVDIMNRFSTSLGDEICPKMIVVGIQQNDRQKDLGLVHDETEILTTNSFTGDPFTKFIEKELQPYVEANFNTMPYRVLVGYSLGGLKAMNIIAYNTALFNAYIVIDPSVGNYNNQWFTSSIAKIQEADLSGKSVFLAMAQTMQMGMDTIDIKKDSTTDSRHMRDIMASAEAFRKNSHSFDFYWKYYPDEYHGSVPFIAEYDAFYAIFDWYNLQKLRYLFKSDDSPQAVKEAISLHFEQASGKIGFRLNPPEHYLTDMISYFYFTGKFDKALAVSELLIEYYPDSKNSIRIHQILLDEQKSGNKM